ncbi:hypothetical protein JCM8202_006024 [Rhodotorula sphaerocarpa]
MDSSEPSPSEATATPQQSQPKPASTTGRAPSSVLAPSVDAAGASASSSGSPKKRSCEGPCVYTDDEPASPVEKLSLEEQMVNLRAEMEDLRQEVARLRQGQQSAESAAQGSSPTSSPSSATAANSPPLLPIPSLPLGANHHRQRPGGAAAGASDFRPHPTSVPFLSYSAPASVYPPGNGAAFAPYAAAAAHNGQRNSSGLPPGMPTIMPPIPNYYVPPRMNHLASPYAVSTLPAYPAPPTSRAPLDAVDCPAPGVPPMTSPLERPSLSHPVSYERPVASALPFVPVHSAMPVPSVLPPAALASSVIAPAGPTPTVANLSPIATTGVPVPGNGLDANGRATATPQYYVLLGDHSQHAPAAPAPTGVLWSATNPMPTLGASMSGRNNKGSAAGFGHGSAFSATSPTIGGTILGLGSGSGGGGGGGNGGSSAGGGGNGSRTPTASGAGGGRLGLQGDVAGGRRPSLQHGVPDWQTLLEDSVSTGSLS